MVSLDAPSSWGLTYMFPLRCSHLASLALCAGMGSRYPLGRAAGDGLCALLAIGGRLAGSDSLERMEHASLRGDWKCRRHGGRPLERIEKQKLSYGGVSETRGR